MARKQYDESFKKKIVELYEEGKKVSFLCREYDISRPTVYMWIEKYGKKVEFDLEGKENLTTEEQKRLIKENERLKREVEILKKAVLIIGEN